MIIKNENNIKQPFLLNLMVIISENRFIALLGLLVAVLALLVDMFDLKFNRDSQNEHIVLTQTESKYSPVGKIQTYQYEIIENTPLFINDIQCTFSTLFQNVDGEEFATLYISPIHEKSSKHPVLTGTNLYFKIAENLYYTQILNVDYNNKKIIVQVASNL